MINIALWLIVIMSSIFVAFDSHKNKISVNSNSYSSKNGAVTWLVFCLCLWVLFFPIYLYKRANALKSQNKNHTLGTVAGIGLITAQIVIIFLMFTGDIKMSTAELQTEVEQNIRETWSKEPSLANTHINSFFLIHKTGNQYEGLVEATSDGQTNKIIMDVTYDGKQFMWHVRQ